MSDTEHAVSLRDSDVDEGRSWWLLPHLHDSLGDRYLSFAENGAMVERLHLRDTLASRPHFVDAVRQRVRDLAASESPWLATMQIVEPAAAGSLDLVSEHCATRLVEVHTQDAAAALAVLEQLLFAASILHRVRPDIAHGAIEASRIGLVAEGHVRLLDPAFGSAIAALAADTDREPGDESLVTRVSQSGDVVRCARVGMSLVRGDTVGPEKPGVADVFDDRLIERCSPDVAAWFRRALHLEGTPWADAGQALAALQPLLAGTPESRAALVAALGGSSTPSESAPRGLVVSLAVTEAPSVAAPREERAAAPAPGEPAQDHGAEHAAEHAAQPVAAAAAEHTLAEPAERPRVRRSPPQPNPSAAAPVSADRVAAPAAAPASSRRGTLVFACIALLALVVAAQAVYIVRNLANTTISVSPPPAPAAAPPAAVAAPVVTAAVPPVSLASSGGLAGGLAAPGSEAAAARAPEPRPAAPAGPVGGWLAVRSPIEVDIFRGGELVGTSRSARLMLPEGRHTLELVNGDVGFRQTIVVSIAPGRESTAPVELPNGVVHANAIPWAEVFIDGNRVGQTPLGNLQVPLGPHEVLFRHPALGDRRQSILVTAGTPARISVDLRR